MKPKNILPSLFLMLAVLFPVSTQAQYPLLEYVEPCFTGTLKGVEYVGHGNWIYAYEGYPYTNVAPFHYIVKIDAYGDTLWHHALETDSFQISGSSHPNSLAIDQTADKGIVVSASKSWWYATFGENFAALAKLDSTGQEVWRYQVGENVENFSNVLGLQSGDILASYSNFFVLI